MHVSEILARKGSAVATIGSGISVAEAVSELQSHKVGALVVSDDGSTVDGIVSERDVVRHLATAGASLLEQPVSAIMTADVFTCEPGNTAEELMVLMTSRRIRHLPVVVDSALIGIVSIGDVVKARLSTLEEESRHLQGYIQQSW